MKSIEDYYCATRFRSEIVHITEERDGIKLCDNKKENTFYTLSIIHKYWNKGPITLYSNLCIKCLKKLPDNIKEEVIYNYVLAKVKK